MHDQVLTVHDKTRDVQLEGLRHGEQLRQHGRRLDTTRDLVQGLLGRVASLERQVRSACANACVSSAVTTPILQGRPQEEEIEKQKVQEEVSVQREKEREKKEKVDKERLKAEEKEKEEQKKEEEAKKKQKELEKQEKVSI